MKTAIVIGATGMVGSQLVASLLQDTRFEKVKIFVRASPGIVNDKLEEYITDFDDPDTRRKSITGDVLYSTMGTTLRLAGSKEAQYNIDYSYQYKFAKIAAANGVKEYVLLSASTANPDSKIFYSRMKGELERDIQKLPFETIHIVRPGMLTGDRLKVRTGEKLAGGMMSIVGLIPGLKTLKPIHAREVGRAMINATFRHVIGIHSYNMGDVFKLANRVGG